MKIKVNLLDPESIKSALDQLNTYKRSLNAKASEIARRLSDIGRRVVDYQYSTTSESDLYEVYCIVNGNSSMIIAEGDGVMFLEFGAGVATTDYTYETESEGLPPIFPGSYSQTEGRGFFRPGHEYWYFEHHKYTAVEPCLGFYFAKREMIDQAAEIAIKVFKK